MYWRDEMNLIQKENKKPLLGYYSLFRLDFNFSECKDQISDVSYKAQKWLLYAFEMILAFPNRVFSSVCWVLKAYSFFLNVVFPFPKVCKS